MNTQNLKKLLKIAEIELPVIGYYEAPDKTIFEPIIQENVECVFESWKYWVKGESLAVSNEDTNLTCDGGIRTILGNGKKDKITKEDLINMIYDTHGLKGSKEIAKKWVDNRKIKKPENEYTVIGPLKEGADEYLKTASFLVKPDQLSLLITAAEYLNPSTSKMCTFSSFNSGCGMLNEIFNGKDPKKPWAAITGTDVIMRKHLPSDILIFTVNKLMLEQLCNLDENSLLYKSYWNSLLETRRGTEIIVS